MIGCGGDITASNGACWGQPAYPSPART
jgi:hypothetical protein